MDPDDPLHHDRTPHQEATPDFPDCRRTPVDVSPGVTPASIMAMEPPLQ